MTIAQAFQLAVQHHQAGRLRDAEALYRQVVAAQPAHAEALHHIGLIAHQLGRHDLAVEWIRKAIALQPNNSAAHSNLGEACRALGRLDEAAAACRRALQLQPGFPEAHNNLGNALRQRGRLDEAIAAFRRALECRPDYAEAHNNLGAALTEKGELAGAVAACRRALELRPGYPEAQNNLGNALRDRGELAEAVAAYGHALGLNPHIPETYSNLGIALREQGQMEQAIAAFHRALTLRPGFASPYYHLGIALREVGQLDQSVAAYRRALELKPDYPEALNNLGVALREQGKLDEAIAAFRRALHFRPEYPEACYNLGIVFREGGQLDETAAAYRRALELKPDYLDAQNNLGNTLKDLGQLDEAIAAYRRALTLNPEHAGIHGNLIYTLHYHPGQGARMISEEHRRWNRQFSDPLKPFLQPHPNDRAPGRRLRIGYVSPDFRDHPVGRHLAPLLERHDREQFEIFCYSEVAEPDWLTERFRALAGGWRDTVGISDVGLAEMIRGDAVDILVDLALHTAGNRLPVFARQPAPAQVTWLAYPGSTGLRSIGYRLTDALMDPAEEKPDWSAEEPVRLPDCWCCYDPVGESPEINALPALSGEGVTFGSLNNFAKIHEGVLACWARVLEAVKGSRLLMLSPEGRTRERLRAFFGDRGIGAERVEFVGRLPRWEYLRVYQRIDIGLDPFPFNGMTTTCDALWMGAPVLTLPGAMPASRAGLSLLSSVGLGELAANSEEDYVRVAAELAGDLPRLAGLRATLRSRMQESPLLDAPRFARNVEAAYRSMWERWLAAGG